MSRQPTMDQRSQPDFTRPWLRQRNQVSVRMQRSVPIAMSMKSGWQRWTMAVAATCLFLVTLDDALASQLVPQQQIQVEAANVVAVGQQDDDELRKENNEKYGGGAPLQTNPELEELLRRAQLFANEGQYRNATLLWQKVLSDSGDSLVTADGETYYALTTAVEETIAGLPADGLRQYRVTADGEARAAMASAASEEEGMEIVVRQYFLSSFGDEAAFYLGSLALDRYDFLNAQRMFRKIIETYPDPTVPMGQVWLRLAVSASRVGDQATAQDAIAQAKNNSMGVTDAMMSAIVSDVQTAPNQLLASDSGDPFDWRMRMGRPSRRGAMPALPESIMDSDLASIWSHAFPIDKTALAESANLRNASVRSVRISRTTNQVTSDSSSGEVSKLTASWRKNHWQPVGQMLVAEGQVIFKTNNDLVSWNIDESTEIPAWRSLWLNAYQQDDASRTLMAMRQAYGVSNSSGTKPTTPVEVMYFGDAIHQSMSVVGDMVISIEGERYSRYGQSPQTETANQRAFNWNVMPRRTRTNWMTAYDLHTGKLLWHTPAKSTLRLERAEAEGNSDEVAAEETEREEAGELGFMAAPIPFGRLLLVPVSDGGTIWIHALDADRGGEVVWSSYLCDEPSGGSEVWSPVGMSLDGRDLYVVCGTGVVFSLDAGTGSIRFARRYARDGEQNQDYARFGRNMSMMELEGWQEDIIIPYGNSLVVLASDHDKLFALDRQTGEFQWNAPRAPFDEPAEYCMGLVGSKLYCGGPNTVICYDLAGEGRLTWAPRLPGNSYGRGMVTGDGVYMPVEDSIVKYDLDSGKVIKRVGVSLSGREPVGNLFSDGQRIWAFGMNEVHALGSLEQHLALLGRAIEAGDLDALAERATLLMKADRTQEGQADLRRLYEARYQANGAALATQELFSLWNSLQLMSEHPRSAIDRLVAYSGRQENAQFAFDRDVLAENVFSVARAVRALGDDINPADGISLLTLARQADLDPVTDAVSEVLVRHANVIPMLAVREMATGDDDRWTRFALPLLVVAGDPEAERIASEHLDSDTPALKMVASRALVNLGNRTGLKGLVDLLDVDDVSIRATVWQSLMDATAQRIPFDALADPDQRASQVQAWQQWLTESADSVELQIPLPPARAYFGRVLVASRGTGEVIEFNAQREVVWRSAVPDVRAVWGLPNGNVLLAYFGRRTIVEMDRDGNEVWKKTQLPGPPTSVQRLQNGNTLVACSQQGGGVFEFSASGEIVWQFNDVQEAHGARRLENGNTLISVRSENRVIEINRNGEVMWELPNQNNPNGVRRLANGNTLICLPYVNVVQEFNENKARVWNMAITGQVYDATRLPSGGTIMATSQGVIEYNSEGKQVWKSELSSMCDSVHAY